MKETRFKYTEVGRIPEDWEVKSIGEIADVKTGPFGSVLHADDYVSEGIPIITVEHIGKIRVDITNGVPCVSDKDYKRLTVYSLKESDLVFSRVGSVDRCSYVSKNEDGWLFSGRLLRVRLKNDVDSLYLTYHLQTNESKQRVINVAVGLAMPSINTKILNGVLIAFPNDKSEQRRIASALTSIDNLIDSLDRLIAKKRAIKQGVMQQLLSGKKRLKGFTEPWVEKRLGEFEFRSGQMLKSSEYKSGNIPVIAGGKNAAGYHNKPNRPSNTITISGSGASAGFVAFHKNPIFASDCSTINEQQSVDIMYLFFCLVFIQEDIFKCQTGGAQPHIHPKDIKDLVILLPTSLSEQQAIAAVLTSMDNELSALEAKRKKYEQIKRGMMQQLLTGKIRLAQ